MHGEERKHFSRSWNRFLLKFFASWFTPKIEEKLQPMLKSASSNDPEILDFEKSLWAFIISEDQMITQGHLITRVSRVMGQWVCLNSNYKTTQKNPGVTYHRFPDKGKNKIWPWNLRSCAPDLEVTDGFPIFQSGLLVLSGGKILLQNHHLTWINR